MKIACRLTKFKGCKYLSIVSIHKVYFSFGILCSKIFFFHNESSHYGLTLRYKSHFVQKVLSNKQKLISNHYLIMPK